MAPFTVGAHRFRVAEAPMTIDHFLASVLEGLPDLVLVVDADYRIAFCNRSLAGMSAHALVGKGLLSLTPPAHRAAVRSHISSVIAGGGWCVDREHLVAHPQDRRTYQNFYCPLRKDGSSKIDAVVITSRDVTRRVRTEEKLRQSERHLHEAQQAAHMGHWVWDVRHDRVHWSPELYRITGIPENSPMTWRRFLDHVVPADRPRVQKIVEQVLSQGRRIEFEHGWLHPDGQLRTFHCCASRIEGEQRRHQLVGTARDVTAMKQRELERRELLARARAAMRSRDLFLAIAAHELKTPLTTIKLTIQHLLMSWAGRMRPIDPVDAREKLQTALDQADRIGGLVERVIEMPELLAGELRISATHRDLCDIILSAVDRHRREARKMGCELITVLPPELTGDWDAERITEVLDQLLSNAVKFGAGRPVEIGAEQRGEVARLWVRDQGLGIAPEHRKAIFARYARAVPDKHYGGVGLGLWITYKVVRAMHGVIRVDSRPGQGATFWVTLPRTVVRAPEVERSVEPEAGASVAP